MQRLAATYSIVARDPVSGDLGIGVEFNYFSVGTDASVARSTNLRGGG